MLNVSAIPVCQTFELALEVDEGDILAPLFPLDAWLLVHLCVEYARQHSVWGGWGDGDKKNK